MASPGCGSFSLSRVGVLFLAVVLAGAAGRAEPPALAPTPEGHLRASILVYHRFGPVAADAMTVRTETFRSQLRFLHEHGYTVVRLRSLIAALRGTETLPPRAVVITVDDGHRSVMTEMWPVIREYGLPVTLFIYPSAISNASYAMTWDQLALLNASGLIDIESHTYWHPNFNVERRRRTQDDYRAFARTQFCKAAAVLRTKAGATPDLLSWPFGIVDEQLYPLARECGYTAGVTLAGRLVTGREDVMALPRFLVTDGAVGRRFEAMLPTPEVTR